MTIVATITKSKAKEFTKLREKHGKILPNYLKHPNEDATKHSPKRITSPKNHKQPMGMPLVRVVLPNKEIYELNNNEIFSSTRIAKTSKLIIYFHFLILVM